MSCTITVPVPCHEHWSQMTPAGQGRHCSTCNKTVVDFTSWSLENIAAYLRKHRAGSVCGRFQTQQLGIEIPYSTEQWISCASQARFSPLQRITLIFLLAFGVLTSGCSSDHTAPPSQSEIHRTTGMILVSPPPIDSPIQRRANQPSKSHSVKHSHKARLRKQAPAIGIEVGVQTTMGAPMMDIEAYPEESHRVIPDSLGS